MSEGGCTGGGVAGRRGGSQGQDVASRSKSSEAEIGMSYTVGAPNKQDHSKLLYVTTFREIEHHFVLSRSSMNDQAVEST